MGLLSDRVAIVTGAGQGLGHSEALELSRLGAAIVVGDIDSAAAEQTVRAVCDGGGRAVPEIGDCADAGMADRLVARALEEFGRLDALVNNAGLLRDRTLAKLPEADWDLVIRVNLRSHYVMTRAAFTHWRSAGLPGRVVCTTSTSGLLGGFGQANYGAAKAGVAAFAVIAAQEGWRHGITVNAISPAARTRLSQEAFGEIGRQDADFDFWHPDNVAPLVGYLCSEAAGGVSGKVFGVQGDAIEVYRPWTSAAVVTNQRRRWNADGLADPITQLLAAAEIPAEPESAMQRLRYSMRAGD